MLLSPQMISTRGVADSSKRSPQPGRRYPTTRSNGCAPPSGRCSVRGTTEGAKEYRRLNGIPDDLGTACNVQTMVFGDLGNDSGTGVCFTRDPSTGERIPYGDYLENAQGEDVVAGIRNTLSLADLATIHPVHHAELTRVMAKLGEPLPRHVRHRVHDRAREVVDSPDQGGQAHCRGSRAHGRGDGERGTHRPVYRSATRRALRTRAPAPSPHQEPITATPIAIGLNASPGAARGQAVFDADRAAELAAEGTPVVLVRWETAPDDIHGMAASRGILTSHGGRTSHAAVVARGMGKPAVTGAGTIDVDEDNRRFTVGGVVVNEGDVITLDGGTGKGLPRRPAPCRSRSQRGTRHASRLGRRDSHPRSARQRRRRPGARQAARWGRRA